MTTHIFGMVLTQEGTFSNNRGEGEGVTSNLQKVFRHGDQWTTVSAEAIRYALRESWQFTGEKLNRTSPTHDKSEYSDTVFAEGKWQQFLDDDILGFMRADKPTRARRAPLEITRAISTTPWRGETMMNFASAGTNISSDYTDGSIKKDANPHPHAVEVHHTRYQFGFALTVDAIGREGNVGDSLHKPEEINRRVEVTLNGITSLRRVGGAHARYFADYSAAAVVLRVTKDPAPRFLYCYAHAEDEQRVSISRLIDLIESGDVLAEEVIVGQTNNIVDDDEINRLQKSNVQVCNGVKAAVSAAMNKASSK